MTRIRVLPAVLASFALLLPIQAAAASDESVLLSFGDVTVTEEDFDRFVEERIPERHRSAALSRPGAVSELLRQLFTIRTLAREAADELDLDAADLRWTLDYRRDRVLMNRLIEQKVAERSERVDWEEAAYEHYLANREDYETEERIKASHILISSDERGDDEALKLAREIADKARAGEDFAALARQYSDDPSVDRNDGDLGRFRRGRMVPEFEEAVFAMTETGEISDPVKTNFGYHVILLAERQEAKPRPFEQVKDGIVGELQRELASDVRAEIVERVRVDERIELNRDAITQLEEAHRSTSPSPAPASRDADQPE